MFLKLYLKIPKLPKNTQKGLFGFMQRRGCGVLGNLKVLVTKFSKSGPSTLTIIFGRVGHFHHRTSRLKTMETMMEMILDH